MDEMREERSRVPVVRVQNLSVQRGRYTAVENVSFELFAGTSTAIVGPNGSGKSTLVQAMLNLIPHSAGTIEIFGRPFSRLGQLWQQIGYMPQNFIFDRSFPLSVSELVALGWGDRGQGTGDRGQGDTENSKFKIQNSKFKIPWQRNLEKSNAITRALQRVNADHLRRQAIGTLSGGELKRVLLAYCLVVPRQLLVLDEAFAEVDVQGEADFYALLRELMLEEGWTVLQISHDLDMVSHNCDQILCLNRSLVCSGRPEAALSAENLLATYGPAFSRYHHHH
ncbi:metal ABC transporter ATP-binding protein [Kovacikia minuta CCNUW1]|uniref:metal ABC transporter ATP-binding protein n=1 Tax=Kovacikia minuta TaxID=2931930 RepID=UPI001CC98804|nr:metal ABC transporter ATP-binding protein [Kovacikia minuta]UBF27857.1 metal ABC transporter ATP-binding protein [Kovacikia minuta CCNUW1]